MVAVKETVEQVKTLDVDQYKYGFSTDLEVDKAPKGLSEDIVRFISAKKGEPEWMLEWRLDAYKRWLTMTEPTWARVQYPQIDFNESYYYAAPKLNAAPKTLDEVDPAILDAYKKLGIPLREQAMLAGVAVDAVFDSIKGALASGGEVRLVGFGTFSVSKRAAREGRNPRTGETIKIAASKQVKFKPGKDLADGVNG